MAFLIYIALQARVEALLETITLESDIAIIIPELVERNLPRPRNSCTSTGCRRSQCKELG